MRGLVLFVLGLALGLFLSFQGCERNERSDSPTPAAWVKPEAQQGKPRVAQASVVEHVTIKKVFVPVVKTETTEVAVTRYLRHDSLIYVTASADSTGLSLDSVSIPNRKTVLFAEDDRGGVTVSVHNTSPFFGSANVIGEYYRPKQVPRLGLGFFAGAVVTPAGVQPGAGVGVVFNVGKRR